MNLEGAQVPRMRVGLRTRCGVSMPELLVAMLVLLVGIWVVAAKFPKLAEIMRGERLRDQMARMAEQRLENAKDGAEWLPSMIAAYDPARFAAGVRYGIDESLSPVYDALNEPDWDDQARPANVVENMLTVVGETFRVPAPEPGAPVPDVPYFLKLGPAAQLWWVYQPIPLTRDDRLDPTQVVTPYPGTFYARDDGTLRLVLPDLDPQGNPFTPALSSGTTGTVVEVTYAWVDASGQEHWMHGEQAAATPDAAPDGPWTTAVLSGIAAGGGIVPDSVTCTYRSPYDVANYTGGPVPVTSPPTVALDATYGHALWFNAGEQGKTLCVDYRLRPYLDPGDPADPDNDRRIPLIREVHRVPDEPADATVGTYEVTLDHRFIEDQVPLFQTDLAGAPLAAPYDQIHVIAFDTETGSLYTAADGTLTVDYLAEGQPVSGWENGRISFPSGSPAAGRELLFYYRTLNEETVQLQRAPASFAEDIWTGQSPPALMEYWAIGRWYYPSRDGSTYDATSPTLLLPDCCLSQTVRVEYVGRAGRTVELHTLGTQSPATVTVDDPVPGSPATARIISVAGVSVKAFASWLNRARMRTTSVETLLSSQLEPTLAKEPRATVQQP